MDWPLSMILRLHEMWPTGRSASSMGRDLGVSKSAVLGKAHRLGLPARLSPIIQRDGLVPKPRKPSRAPRVTLEPMAAAIPVQDEPLAAMPGRNDACCFPLWPDALPPPRDQSHALCCQPVWEHQADDGRPVRSVYCLKHHQLCYAGR